MKADIRRWNDTSGLTSYDGYILPGGWAYEDRIRAGVIAAKDPVMDIIKRGAEAGKVVLGICNGFQILTETGLLPGALKRNDNLHFISKHHHLKIINNDNTFLSELNINDVVNIPVAHHDGNYFIDPDGLKELEANGQVLLRYCDKDGNNQVLNGSVEQIAGVCNKEKNVFGLMPHPERAMESLLGCDDGVKMLQGFFK